MHSFNSVHGFFVSWPLAADWRAAGMEKLCLNWVFGTPGIGVAFVPLFETIRRGKSVPRAH